MAESFEDAMDKFRFEFIFKIETVKFLFNDFLNLNSDAGWLKISTNQVPPLTLFKFIALENLALFSSKFSWDALQSLHANHRSHWFSSRHGKSCDTNAIGTEPSQWGDGKT